MENFRFRTNKERRNDIDISICIPTYKRSKYLINAIDSAVNQHNHDLITEIIVINNDPDDEMADLIMHYSDYKNVHFVSNVENLGMIGNMNQCINLAKGKYVSYLHDDDMLCGNYLKLMNKYIRYIEKKNIKADCIVTRRYLVSNNYLFKKIIIKRILSLIFGFRKIYRHKLKKISEIDCCLTWRNCFLPPTCGTMFLAESLKKYGGMNGDFGLAWDFDFFLNFSKKNNIYVINKYVAKYRLDTGLSNKVSTQYEFYKCFENLLKNNSTKLKKYYKEIAFLNFNSHTEEVKKYIIEKDNVYNIEHSKIKLLIFKIKRMIHYYVRNLDNEKYKKGE